jgi:hypothetical protein
MFYADNKELLRLFPFGFAQGQNDVRGFGSLGKMQVLRLRLSR